MRYACLFVIVISLIAAPAQAQWLSGWPCRRPVAISNPCAEELSGHQVRVSLDNSFDFGAAGQEGNGLRFTESDGTTLLPFWIEEWRPENSFASVTVRVPYISAGGDSIYMYYGDSTAVSGSNGAETFDMYDGFEDYTGDGGNPGEWSRSESNPQITEGPSGAWDDHGATFASVIWDEAAEEFRMYYHGFAYSGAHQVGLATASSPDGPWTKHPANPVLAPGPDSWDGHSTRVPMVWKEDSTYHMIYTGYSGSSYQLGYAYSSDGISWTKHPSNPVFNDPGWAHDQTENWGVMKVGSEYLVWYSSFGMRQIGVAVSTDLVNWTAHQSDPVFASSGDTGDDRYSQYCPFSFKYGDDYYILVCSYDGSWNYSKFYLYRSSSPYFPESDRHLVRVAHTVGQDGEWDDHDSDTPFVLTMDIERTQFYNDQIWCYYAGEGGANLWKEGLHIETDIAAALSDAPLPGAGFGNWNHEGDVSVVTSPVHGGERGMRQNDTSSSGATRLTTMIPERESGVVGAWMRRDSDSEGDYDIYIYGEGGATLCCAAGLGRDGDFHYWNGAFQPTGIYWALDTWYLVSLCLDAAAGTYDFLVFDRDLTELVRAEDVSFGGAVSSIDKALIYTSMGYVGEGYVDDFRVARWCGAQPRATLGDEETEDVTGVEEDSPGPSCALGQNFPNPFNPSTTIRYDLAGECRVSLVIYNVAGLKVATLVDGKREAGRREARWNGKDSSGRPAPSGIYFYRLRAGSFTDTKKMILMR